MTNLGASNGLNSSGMLNLPPLRNMTPQNYNLLNIEDTEERPYFFGLGLPSRFNCNKGFQHDSLIDDSFLNGDKSKL
jgi:hypothetical protein